MTGTTERERARSLASRLADELVAKAAIRSDEWRRAFASTLRHRYIPCIYRLTAVDGVNGWERLDGGDPAQRPAWLQAAYQDEAWTTKIDGTDQFTPVSSSTMPTLMAVMLEALDVRDTSAVLEIGTGTGYNAALLCERLGSTQVTSVDIDAALIGDARRRLAAQGHHPTLATADGAAGYLANAPYDRIIATCSVERIPPAWLEQTRPGGVIVTDLRGSLEHALVRLQLDDHGGADGVILPEPAYFMPLRASAGEPERGACDLVQSVRPDGGTDAPSRLDPALLEDRAFRFFAQRFLPHLVRMTLLDTATRAATSWLVTTDASSWVKVTAAAEEGSFNVRQGGPLRLWDELAQARLLWHEAGSPQPEHYRLRATPQRLMLWLDRPEGRLEWEL